MPNSRFTVIPGLASIPGAPNGNVSIFKPVPAGWNPSLIASSLTAWQKASDAVQSGTRVQSWPNHNAIGPTLTGTNNPLLTTAHGIPVVVPDTSSGNLGTVTPFTSYADTKPFSLVYFVNIDTSQRNLYSDLSWFGPSVVNCCRVGFQSPSGGAVTFDMSGLNSIADHARSLTVKGSTIPANGAATMIGVTYDGTGKAAGVNIYIDGVADTVTTVNDAYTIGNLNLASGYYVVGSNYGGNTWAKDGVFETLSANRVLTAAEMVKFSTYFHAQTTS